MGESFQLDLSSLIRCHGRIPSNFAFCRSFQVIGKFDFENSWNSIDIDVELQKSYVEEVFVIISKGFGEQNRRTGCAVMSI